MVGFHIQDYCLNFVDCCQRSLGCRVDRKNLLVEHGGRTVRVRPLPIGIPFDRFVSLAETANKVMLTNQKIVLGVDRLDYTKGLVHRLKAFEMLLEKHPEHREQVIVALVSGGSYYWRLRGGGCRRGSLKTSKGRLNNSGSGGLVRYLLSI